MSEAEAGSSVIFYGWLSGQVCLSIIGVPMLAPALHALLGRDRREANE